MHMFGGSVCNLMHTHPVEDQYGELGTRQLTPTDAVVVVDRLA
jgi:hypothetical protein